MRLASRSRFQFSAVAQRFSSTIVIVAFTETACAECMPQKHIHAVSPNGVFELTINFGTKNQFTVTREGISIRSGEIQFSGHHNTGYINDTGSFFVLLDHYEG